MSELTPRPPSELSDESRSCLYCGAPLDARYYFCLQCATPHSEPESVLTPIRPLRPTAGMLVKKHAPGVSTLWWTYFSVIVGLSVVLWVVAGGAKLGVHMIVMDAALLVTTAWFAVYYWPSLWPQLKRIGFDRGAAWIGLLLLVPTLALNYGYGHLIEQLVGGESWSFIEQLRKDGFPEEAIVFFICVFPAVAEEIAFRGLLQHWLQVALSPRRAILLASALFSAMHFSILGAPYLFVAGCLMGWVKWKTGSLYPSMLIHFLHNLAVVAVLEG
jgi:membrane protease YdiL (CAAX protease family)